MSKKFYVFSTLSNTNRYTNYAPAPNGGQPQPSESVIIQGGSNVMGKHLITPHGVMTEIDEKQMEILKVNFLFNQHMKSGHIVVRDSKREPEKVVSDGMEKEDGAAPVTPESLKKLNLEVKPAQLGRMAS